MPQQNEERTVIYVLTKQSDVSDINASVQDTPTVPSKPEVFFIKYKTQEEALNAQRQIQGKIIFLFISINKINEFMKSLKFIFNFFIAQFETLGGSTQISDEGTVPVSSVIGSTGSGGHTSQDNLGSSGTSSSLSSNRYLPPRKYRN